MLRVTAATIRAKQVSQRINPPDEDRIRALVA